MEQSRADGDVESGSDVVAVDISDLHDDWLVSKERHIMVIN